MNLSRKEDEESIEPVIAKFETKEALMVWYELWNINLNDLYYHFFLN